MSEQVKLGGHRHQPVRTWVEVEEAFGDLLPTYPGASTIAVAKLPHPPLIKQEWQEPRAALHLALWYSAAVAREYEVCRSFTPRQLTDAKALLQSKHYPALVNAVAISIEHKIAPASWTAFSIEVWRKYAVGGAGAAWNSIPSKRKGPPRTMPPPVKWVFAITRLSERTDWFAWHEAKFRGGRLWIAPAHKSLMRRYDTLQNALLAAPTLTKEVVETAVAEHLSSATYARLKKKAEEEGEWQTDEWNDQLRRGVWLW